MPVPSLPPLQAPRLLYSLRTEQAHVQRVHAFVRFHHTRHPREMGQPEVEAFLSWLATERHVAVFNNRQALLGHSGARTTMIDPQVLKVGGGAVRRPLDTLLPA